MRVSIGVLALALAIVARGAGAQDDRPAPPSWRPELRPFLGISAPAGPFRHEITSDAVMGLQAAAELRPTFHLVASFAWMLSQTRQATPADVDMLQYDAGVERGLVRQLSLGVQLRPFVGIGAGARTYLYRASTFADRTCAAGYAALGAELQLDESAMRVEARGNVFCYYPPDGDGSSHMRTDVALVVGYAHHFR